MNDNLFANTWRDLPPEQRMAQLREARDSHQQRLTELERNANPDMEAIREAETRYKYISHLNAEMDTMRTQLGLPTRLEMAVQENLSDPLWPQMTGAAPPVRMPNSLWPEGIFSEGPPDGIPRRAPDAGSGGGEQYRFRTRGDLGADMINSVRTNHPDLWERFAADMANPNYNKRPFDVNAPDEAIDTLAYQFRGWAEDWNADRIPEQLRATIKRYADAPRDVTPVNSNRHKTGEIADAILAALDRNNGAMHTGDLYNQVHRDLTGRAPNPADAAAVRWGNTSALPDVPDGGSGPPDTSKSYRPGPKRGLFFSQRGLSG